MSESRQRKRPQLRLSTLFFLVALVALAAAWWADHSRLQRRLQAQNYQIKIFTLVHAKSDELAPVVSELYATDMDNMLDVASDARTNSLIIRGPEAKLLEVEATLMRLDQASE